MAFVNCPLVQYPARNRSGSEPTITSSALVINDNADKVGLVFTVPPTMSGRKIDEVGFRVGALTTAADIDTQLVSLGTDGFPSASLYKNSSEPTLTNPAAATFYWVPVACQSDAVPGDYVALTLTCSTGTPNFQIAYNSSGSITGGGSSYCCFNPAGVGWAKQTIQPIIGIKDDLGNYHSVVDAYSVSAVGYVNTTSSSSKGLVFKVPIAAKLGGVSFSMDNDEDLVIDLFKDSSGTLESLMTASIDKDYRMSTSTQIFNLYFQPITLEKDVDYYLVFKNSGAAMSALYYDDYGTVGSSWLAGSHAGANFRYCSASTATPTATSDFTELAYRQPRVVLYLSALDDGSGTGSSGGAYGG